MSITENFLVNTKNFDAIIEELRTAVDLPEKITNKFLEQQGYSNPSDLLVLHLFKDLSMLNEDGSPTELFDKFRNKDTGKQAMAQGIVEAYVDLFKSNSLVYRSNLAELKEEFKKFFGSSKSDLILKYMANTFLTLVEYAGRENVEVMADKYLENVSGIEEVIREVAEKQKNGTSRPAADTTEEEIAVAETDEKPRETLNKEEKGEIDIDQLISITNPTPTPEEIENEGKQNTSNSQNSDVVEHVEPSKDSEKASGQQPPRGTDETDIEIEEEIVFESADEEEEVTSQNSVSDEMEEETQQTSEKRESHKGEPISELLDTEEENTDFSTTQVIEDQVNLASNEEEPAANESTFDLSAEDQKEREEEEEETKFEWPTEEINKREASIPGDTKDEDLPMTEKEQPIEKDTDPFGFKAIMDFDKKSEKIAKPQTEKNPPVAKPVSTPDSPSSESMYVNKAFLKKAELLYKLEKYEEALPALQAVIDRYGNSRESEYSDHVARAIFHRAFVLEKLERPEKALTAYEEVYKRFENSEKIEYYNQASNALIKRIEIMEQLNLDEKITSLYSKVIERLSDSDNPRYSKYVDKAYFIQVEKLTESDDPKKALKALTAVIQRFQKSEKKNDFLKKAMYMKAELLEQLGKEEEALEAYDSILMTFGNES